MQELATAPRLSSRSIARIYAEGTKEKLSKPAAVWVMKELGILRVFVAGVINMDL